MVDPGDHVTLLLRHIIPVPSEQHDLRSLEGRANHVESVFLAPRDDGDGARLSPINGRV